MGEEERETGLGMGGRGVRLLFQNFLSLFPPPTPTPQAGHRRRDDAFHNLCVKRAHGRRSLAPFTWRLRSQKGDQRLSPPRPLEAGLDQDRLASKRGAGFSCAFFGRRFVGLLYCVEVILCQTVCNTVMMMRMLQRRWRR